MNEKNINEIKDCFLNAIKDEEKGKKHRGLLVVKPDDEKAKEYIQKAKMNIELCELYKEKRFDYKISEEWFYTLYYCALAILSKFGVESRSQRCTASFLKYIKNKGITDFDNEFIDRITVYKDKDEESDVDKREKSRYGSSIKSEEVIRKYSYMTELCKKAISQAEEIVFSDKTFNIPEELYSIIKSNNKIN